MSLEGHFLLAVINPIVQKAWEKGMRGLVHALSFMQKTEAMCASCTRRTVRLCPITLCHTHIPTSSRLVTLAVISALLVQKHTDHYRNKSRPHHNSQEPQRRTIHPTDYHDKGQHVGSYSNTQNPQAESSSPQTRLHRPPQSLLRPRRRTDPPHPIQIRPLSQDPQQQHQHHSRQTRRHMGQSRGPKRRSRRSREAARAREEGGWVRFRCDGEGDG